MFLAIEITAIIWAYKSSGYQNLASQIPQNSIAHSKSWMQPGDHGQLCLGWAINYYYIVFPLALAMLPDNLGYELSCPKFQ